MYGQTAYSMQGRTLSKGKIDLTMSSPMDPTTGYVAMSRFRSASDVLIMQPFDLGFYQQGPTLEPELFIQYNRMRLVERLDNESLRALFDNYTTKSERKRRRKAEESKPKRDVQGQNARYYKANKEDVISRVQDNHKRARTPKTTPNPTPANSPQKRPAPSQAGSPSKIIVRRQRMSSATFVKQELMFVLNPDKNNVIALQLGKSVGPGERIKPRK
jgi:hypothetical protein